MVFLSKQFFFNASGKPGGMRIGFLPIPWETIVTRILLIDDDDDYSRFLQVTLEEQGYQVVRAETAEDGLTFLAKTDFDLLMLDYMLPGMSGIDCLAALQKHPERIGVILMTGHGDPDVAIEAAKLGAIHYVDKPFGPGKACDELVQRVHEAVETARLRKEPVQLPFQHEAGRPGGTVLLGKSKLMLEVYARIGRVADSQTAVLILGETGSGKELVARAIFQHDSRRKDKPFVAVNCAAIPETLLESELFGHEKGAFAGAERRRVGKFEQANGGTILLDEIGDMSPSAQAKILRVLQEGEFTRVGGNEVVKVDVRVIACTHQDLESSIHNDKFRPDLYYRLNGVTIRLPPLRQRADDILLLADHFLDRAAEAMGRPRVSLHEKARALLQRYPWPGNVRELQKVVVRAFLVCRGPQILSEDLELASSDGQGSDEREVNTGIRQAIEWAWNAEKAELWPLLQELLEKELLIFALEKLDGNRTAVAERLKMTRGTVIKRLEKYGLQ
jgi:two-component system nitrogen regulation response regulator GlnG